MSETTTRRAFLREVGSGAVDVPTLEVDSRTAGAGLERADANRDGAIEGEREVDALFRLLDRVDGSSDGRVRVTDARGRARGAAPMLDAIREARRGGLRVEGRSGSAIEQGVVVVGMSDTAIAEARALRRVTATLLVGDVRGRMDFVRGSDGRTYDLASPAGLRSFVAGLRVSHEVADGIVRVVSRAAVGARRELAELARAWAPAERGEPIARRLMVSGHGDGDYFSGDDRDFFRVGMLFELARAMPRAAGRVDAIHLASCQHGYEERMQAFVAVFPNVQSIWGYAGFSSSGSAAHTQQAAWERATRDLPAGGGGLSSRLAGHTRRSEAVRVWTRAHGFDGPPSRPLRRVLVDLEATRGEMKRYFWGELDNADPMSGPLARHYELLQELTSHVDFDDLPVVTRAKLVEERDQTLRLRYWPRIAATFARVHAAAIAAGYRAMGLHPPTFEHMTRGEALAAIEELRSAQRASAPAATRALLAILLPGLRDLSSHGIPFSWV